MNLKEIGILLVLLFVGSTLLISYKYFVAKGKVFQISRVLVFKYILRFILLITFLLLCFYTISSKQQKDFTGQKGNATLLVISSNSSSLTWNSLLEKVNEMPENGTYQLTIYDALKNQFLQVIPSTNRESFLNLVERAHESTMTHPKRLWADRPQMTPKEDQFLVYVFKNERWQLSSGENNRSTLFSNNSLNNLIGSSYVRLYLVILLLILMFIDSVFTAKAIKI